MYKINATTYGIPFVSSLINTEMICQQLNRTVNSSDLNILKPYEISLMLKKQSEILNRENTENIIKDSNISTDLNLYANYSDLMFNIVETKLDEEYVEKIFVMFDDIKMKEFNINEEESNYFNTIRLLNLENASLFEMIQQLGFNLNQISLTNLIDVLYNMTEMKNLIVVDLTCSTTEDKNINNYIIRRELIKQKLY